jgi:hypothetical protein
LFFNIAAQAENKGKGPNVPYQLSNTHAWLWSLVGGECWALGKLFEATFTYDEVNQIMTIEASQGDIEGRKTILKVVCDRYVSNWGTTDWGTVQSPSL